MRRKWLILVLICIGFILIHSAIPEIKSAHESAWITERVINPFLSQFGIAADTIIVRKVAHGIEFGILTIVIFFCFKKQPVRSFYFGFTLAFLDESLQVITGRGALVTDIWVDLIGVAIGMSIGKVISMIRSKTNGETTCEQETEK